MVDVFSVSNLSQPTSRSRLGDFIADQMDWANDERLLIGLIQIVSRDARVRSDRSTITDELITHASRRMISLDTVNGGAVVLFENQPGAMAYSIDPWALVDLLPNDPDHILMISRDGARQGGILISASAGAVALLPRERQHRRRRTDRIRHGPDHRLAHPQRHPRHPRRYQSARHL
jgi:hypothetical protein